MTKFRPYDEIETNLEHQIGCLLVEVEMTKLDGSKLKMFKQFSTACINSLFKEDHRGLWEMKTVNTVTHGAYYHDEYGSPQTKPCGDPMLYLKLHERTFLLYKGLKFYRHPMSTPNNEIENGLGIAVAPLPDFHS